MIFNNINGTTLDLLLTRRSEKSKRMHAPGPNKDDLGRILAAGMRVPDHGKLAPWRFIVVEGEAQSKLGEVFSKAFSLEKDENNEQKLQSVKDFTSQAPVMVIVVSKYIQGKKVIPEVEQILSTGAACQNMLVAATSLGFTGQWLTGWAAYNPLIHNELDLEKGDKIAGFLFFGSSMRDLSERPRPNFKDIVTYWSTKNES
jgi:nitroreductase